MALGPVAPDPAIFATLLDAEDANVDAVAPGPAHPAVNAPQTTNPYQPVQGQAHHAQQAPRV